MKKFFAKLVLKFLQWTEVKYEVISIHNPWITCLTRDLACVNAAIVRIENRIDRITEELMTIKAAAARSKIPKKSSKFRKVK